MESDALQIWRQHLSNRAESTRDSYQRYFQRFLEWSQLTADELRQLKYEEEQNQKPWERSRVENLVREYLGYLEKEGLAGSTRQTAITGIKSFFASQNLPLHLTTADLPNCAYVHASAIPNRDDVKKMVQACDHIRNRVLILFLKDSGLRQSDLEGLKWKDLQPWTDGFMGFKIETQKKKILARGFVGSETTESLEILKRKRLRGTDKIPPEKNLMSHPIFSYLYEPEKPLLAKTMSYQISEILKLAGLKDKGLTAHGLRKFFEQNLHTEHVYKKQLNGRALSHDVKAYNWLTTEKLFQIYKENYDNLRVLTRPISKQVEEIETRIRREYEGRIRQLEEKLERTKTMPKISLFQSRESIETLIKTKVAEELRKRGLAEEFIAEE